MKSFMSLGFSFMLFQFFIFLILMLSGTTAAASADFFQCFSMKIRNKTSSVDVVYTKTDSDYLSILDFSIYNRRFSVDTTTPKPLYIVTPTNPSHVQAAVVCAKLNNLQVRIRSGGHDLVAVSYASDVPFIIIDLFNLKSVTVDLKTNTAWVEGGATLGELYYHVANASDTLAFPAGICPTVGVGGHISGGGIGMLSRKYGLAADQVIDAKLIDVNGNILDRKSMGEDLFWALRGGGGNNFGVIISWKVNLVTIPSKVAVFQVIKTLEENATQLVYRWQEIASQFPEDILVAVNCTRSAEGVIQTSFMGQYLGTVENLISLMEEKFPELGLTSEYCQEMRWVEAAVRFARYPTGSKIESLLDRTQTTAIAYTSKADYIKEPIPESGLEGVWEWFAKDEAKIAFFLLTPGGGRMSEISESATPYPHRSGNLYIIQYAISWTEQGSEASQKYLDWMTGLYNYTKPYASKNPREAYINFRDLDLGTNNAYGKYTSYEQAKVWGASYYKDNFDRLVRVKTNVDPTNFFRHQQSIVPLTKWK